MSFFGTKNKPLYRFFVDFDFSWMFPYPVREIDLQNIYLLVFCWITILKASLRFYRLDGQVCIKNGVVGPLFIYKMFDNTMGFPAHRYQYPSLWLTLNYYVDTILSFFDHLPTSKWTFLTLKVDRNNHFWPPTHLFLST